MPVARSAADILWMATAVTTAIRHPAAQRKRPPANWGLAASQRVRVPSLGRGPTWGVRQHYRDTAATPKDSPYWRYRRYVANEMTARAILCRCTWAAYVLQSMPSVRPSWRSNGPRG